MTLFTVRKLDINSATILELPETHFLKHRKKMEYGQFRRFNGTSVAGLLDEREEKGLTKVELHQYKSGDAFQDAAAAETTFRDKINAKPIFLYAHEQPVLILSPEKYKDIIGTVTIIPGAATQTRTLIIPGANSLGDEVLLPSSDTTVQFEDEVDILQQIEQVNETNNSDFRFTSLDPGRGYAGGGRIRKSRKLRKRKFVSRKLKVRKVHKRIHTRRSRTRQTRNI